MGHGRIRVIPAIAASLAAGMALVPPALADEAYDFGEYLSGECTTCHQLSGNFGEIPPILGWPVETFVLVLKAYKNGERSNPVMQSVTKRLSDEEMLSLAVFYEKQSRKE